MRYRIQQIKAIILIGLFSLLSLFFKKKTWVICERGTDARDNGYHFYKYLKAYHPEAQVYYIIDKRSPDYEKVKDDAVPYGSIRNYWVVATCKHLVSTHYALCLPDIGSKLFAACGLARKFYFLQHGIIKDDLPFLYKENAPMRFFCCGAKPEYEWVTSRFGHDEGVVRCTGLARYDALLTADQPKKQILVMPTWRSNIHDEAMFLASPFYKNWQRLLSDQKLNTLLKEAGYTLLFYPHYGLQKYLHCFSFEQECMQPASFENYDVQTLLKESALLITDYSSVFFDFAYMKKPMIYFQFDHETFFTKDQDRGYFRCQTDGFGKVCTDYEELKPELDNLFENQFRLADVYASRIDAFFDKRDTDNCQRIYDVIVSG